MDKNKAELERSLGISGAVALALGIVIGAGLLVLPGMAYRLTGTASIYAWIMDALLVIPLLVIFSWLGSKFPKADGIAGFVRQAFGDLGGTVTEVMLLGTFTLGIPAIAIGGGHYFAYAFGAGQVTALVSTLAILLIAGWFNYKGTRLSSTFQQWITYLLVFILVAVAIIGLLWGDPAQGGGVAPPSMWTHALPALALVFFAFTGFEMLSFTAEEYKNPRRDYPITVAISFVIIVGLYLALAWVTQTLLPQNHPDLATAPIAAILTSIFGGASGRIIAIVGVLIVIANVNGATWAASRLVFAASRNGLLPASWHLVDEKSHVPRQAVVATTLIFLGSACIYAIHWFSQETMLQLAGQNFFLLYVFSVLAYIRLVQHWAARLFGVASVLLCFFMMGTFGWGLLYPGALLLLGWIAVRMKKNRMTREEKEVPESPSTTL
ncbi:APC family permease [Marininema halotolerans]|uniref:Amino acid efflux transporter n=1 Tax=Marininema halotolerans TaxID=1155944 RepID=A0A1I6QNW2_9BACL|nr:amino acid permease [Marininema halotolerans]SFS54157.1 amino acid efflux transporter [Marininema halotolerans]